MSLFRWLAWCGSIGLLLCLSACALNHRYNARSHQQLQGLEVMQRQFIKEGATTPLDVQALQNDDRQIRMQFRQAITLAQSLGDTPRTNTLLTLKAQYLRLRARLSQQQHAFTPTQATLYQQQARFSWQLAIEGECSRSGASCDAWGK